MSHWDLIGRQLRRPTGFLGRLAGHAMEIANRGPNRAAIDALNIKSADDILELGFGPGGAIKEMAALAPLGKIYGVDRSTVMVARARKRNIKAICAGRVVLKHGHFEDVPLPDASVDKILAVNVVYFWDDAGSVLAEVQRVLRPGGLVSIYATDAATMRRWKFAGPETHRTFDADTLAKLLRNDSFDSDKLCIREIRIALNVSGLVATVSKCQ